MMNFIRDMIEQVWTLVGLGCAWLVLEGSARTITGYTIIVATLFWAATYPIRNPREDSDADID